MKKLITIICILYSISAFSQNDSIWTFQATTYTIIQLDTSKFWTWQVKGNSPSDINSTEMIVLDSLLKIVMEENRQGKSGPNIIDNKTFLKQVVPTIDSSGNKIIFVNCLCLEPELPSFYENNPNDWKEEIIEVNDGGGCFWHVKINLSEISYSELYVNGI